MWNTVNAVRTAYSHFGHYVLSIERTDCAETGLQLNEQIHAHTWFSERTKIDFFSSVVFIVHWIDIIENKVECVLSAGKKNWPKKIASNSNERKNKNDMLNVERLLNALNSLQRCKTYFYRSKTSIKIQLYYFPLWIAIQIGVCLTDTLSVYYTLMLQSVDCPMYCCDALPYFNFSAFGFDNAIKCNQTLHCWWKLKQECDAQI